MTGLSVVMLVIIGLALFVAIVGYAVQQGVRGADRQREKAQERRERVGSHRR